MMELHWNYSIRLPESQRGRTLVWGRIHEYLAKLGNLWPGITFSMEESAVSPHMLNIRLDWQNPAHGYDMSVFVTSLEKDIQVILSTFIGNRELEPKPRSVWEWLLEKNLYTD